jgi:hypothetical protein
MIYSYSKEYITISWYLQGNNGEMRYVLTAIR